MKALLTLLAAILLSDGGVVFAQQMTLKQAASILSRRGEWPPASYITPNEASKIFDFDGKLDVAEDIQFGNAEDISNIVIKPEDNSFERILVSINSNGTDYGLFASMAKADAGDPTKTGSIRPIRLADGAKGYFVPYDDIVVRSPNGQFDVLIEIGFYEDRGTVVVTDSNKKLADALYNSHDNGLAFMTAAINKIYPLAKQKYQNQIQARAEIREATILFTNKPATGAKPSPSGN